jgi:hypothetical protein
MRGLACEATATGVTVIVDFTNEIAIDNDVTSRMESLLALLDGCFLIGCGDGKQMLTTGGLMSESTWGEEERTTERTQAHVC